jgi:ABC-type nitrate/sulfonate/bicarbonate transport system ATPase subunit
MPGDLPAENPKIAVRGLSKTFRTVRRREVVSTPALVDIDLSVASGELVSLLGPSGCGKTTLLRIIAGLETADEGTVEIDGVPVSGTGTDRAMVFQSFGLLPWRTIAQNVAFPLKVRKLSNEVIADRVERYLDLVGLAHVADRYPYQLSGGMQQRVGLARALAVESDVLLMDEPFGAIDAQQRELMQEELLKIWETTGKTILIITHDIDEAVYLSQRIIQLSPHPGRVRGELVVDLPPQRWEYDARAEPRFAELRGSIWSTIRGDVIRETDRERGEGSGA